jgi:hypothetical protein
MDGTKYAHLDQTVLYITTYSEYVTYSDATCLRVATSYYCTNYSQTQAINLQYRQANCFIGSGFRSLLMTSQQVPTGTI